MMADCLFYCVHYLSLKRHQQRVLCNKQLHVLLGSEVRLIDVPAKHLLIFFAIGL